MNFTSTSWNRMERKLQRMKRRSWAYGCAWGFGMAVLLVACYLLATKPTCDLDPTSFLGGTITECK